MVQKAVDMPHDRRRAERVPGQSGGHAGQSGVLVDVYSEDTEDVVEDASLGVVADMRCGRTPDGQTTRPGIRGELGSDTGALPGRLSAPLQEVNGASDVRCVGYEFVSRKEATGQCVSAGLVLCSWISRSASSRSRRSRASTRARCSSWR